MANIFRIATRGIVHASWGSVFGFWVGGVFVLSIAQYARYTSAKKYHDEFIDHRLLSVFAGGSHGVIYDAIIYCIDSSNGGVHFIFGDIVFDSSSAKLMISSSIGRW